MTQFALVITKDSHDNLIPVEKQQDHFLLKTAKKIFPDSPAKEIFVLDSEGKNIDQLMLDAQKTVDYLPFEKTELYQTISKIIPTIDELGFWYGSDYNDLDYIYDVSTLLSKLKEAVSESACELYVHYRRSKPDT